MQIRTATLDDAPQLCDYAARLLDERLPGIFRRDTPTLDQEIVYIRSFTELANSTLLIAEHDGVVMGLAGLQGGSSAEEGHVATLAVSVAREFRGRGVGTALIEALLAWAPEHGVRRVQLWAWDNNPGALALYERLGFEREGRCRDALMVDGEPVDTHLLAIRT